MISLGIGLDFNPIRDFNSLLLDIMLK